MWRLLAAVAALLAPAAARAQDAPASVVASPPSSIAVTVYRDPNGRGGIDLERLGGFALVTETRTVRVPAGTSTIRFEGVAGGIVPVSAIVTGLPGGTVEKNRDARLLSPASLVDGSLGRRVTLRRTDRATGAVREEVATIVAGPAAGVVLRTESGVEALRCSGLPEKLIYPGVPPGLSAQPVLSVTTRSPRAATATVTLSYLAQDFDWRASYVATLRPDGRTLDLFAWLTLANGNPQALPDAEVNAVAGRLNREALDRIDAAAAQLFLRCYPLGTTTSDLPDESRREEIVVTGARLRNFDVQEMMVVVPAVAPPPPPPPPPPEDLGDLKLYRVPMRVGVEANQQKQVALLARGGVPFERIHRVDLSPSNRAARPTRIELRMRNTAAGGLGLALPGGSTALYQDRAGARLLLGLGKAEDTAEGQRFAIDAGASEQVLVAETADASRRATATITNANAIPVTVEARIGGAGDNAIRDATAPLERIDGVWTWRVTVPANGTAALSYSY